MLTLIADRDSSQGRDVYLVLRKIHPSFIYSLWKALGINKAGQQIKKHCSAIVHHISKTGQGGFIKDFDILGKSKNFDLVHLNWIMLWEEFYFTFKGGYNLSTISYSMEACVKSLLGDPCPLIEASDVSERYLYFPTVIQWTYHSIDCLSFLISTYLNTACNFARF